MNQTPQRLASIDIFRAITMLLMIFVNDLWTLKDIPLWLEHTEAAADGMGLADTIFPAFLFIVGLSIPLAIAARRAKGDSTAKIIQYILVRSLALLLMGFFHVNLESYSETALLPKWLWQILITLGFFLVWLDYNRSMDKRKRFFLQASGIILLVMMAALYKGADNGTIVWMKPYWWGILGLIGWTYLIASVVFVFLKGNITAIAFGALFFLAFNFASQNNWLNFLDRVKEYVWIVGDGSMVALAMAGTTITLLYQKLYANNKTGFVWVALIGIGIVFLAIGFAVRPYGGISKIRATPSWAAICTGISVLVFTFIAWIVDLKRKENIFNIIKPAGTSTLTVYLLPYIHYALYSVVGYSIPVILRTGVPGILKSLLYAFLIVMIAGVLEKKRIRLKV